MAGLKTLAFCSREELRKIASELFIDINGKNNNDIIYELKALGVQGIRNHQTEIANRPSHIISVGAKEKLLSMLKQLHSLSEPNDHTEIESMIELIKKYI